MPAREEDRYRNTVGGHVPACTCVDCVNRRLSRYPSNQPRQPLFRQPTIERYQPLEQPPTSPTSATKTPTERYRQRRNKGLGQFFGSIGSILFGVAWILGVIAIGEFTAFNPSRVLGFPGGLFIIGGLVGLIAGVGDLIWAVVDDRPRQPRAKGWVWVAIGIAVVGGGSAWMGYLVHLQSATP